MSVTPSAASGGSTSMPTTGRWDWYQDHEGNEFRRVSKLLEYAETKPGMFHLNRWHQRQVAEGLALRDDLVLAIKSMGRPGEVGWSKADKKKLDSIVWDAQRAAKERDGAVVGTAVHDLTERLDRGEALEDVVRGLPAATATAVRAYEFLLRANGWRVMEIERTVQVEELENVTGSLDREYLIPGLAALLGPGTCQHDEAHGITGPHYGPLLGDNELPVIGDVKTEAQPWLNGIHIAPQMAIYSRAKKMWRATGGTRTVERYGREFQVPNGEYVPAPCVRQDVAVVVHVHDGRAHPYFVRLDAGWRTARRAYEQMCDEREAKRELGAAGAWFAVMPNIVEPKPAELLVAHAVTAGYGRPRVETPTVPGAHFVALPELTMPAPSAAPPSYVVGDTVKVAGIEFTKHAEWPTAEQVHAATGSTCDNCAPLVSGASVSRVDGSEATDFCLTCGADPVASEVPVMVGNSFASTVGDTLSHGGVVTHEAVRRPDGLVGWQPVAADAAPGASTVPVAEQPEPHIDGLDLPRMLIAAIWQAQTRERLAELYEMAGQQGVSWAGPVETAGSCRLRQIECPQRALHTGSGKCACGWDSRFSG